LTTKITYRSLFSGLQNNGVTASQSRAELPREHQQRIVPGNDLAANTDRFHSGEAENATISGDSLAMNLIVPACIILQAGNRAVDIEFSLSEGLAIVECLELGNVVLVLCDQVGKVFSLARDSMFCSSQISHNMQDTEPKKRRTNQCC